jgi:hypothetical protein
VFVIDRSVDSPDLFFNGEFFSFVAGTFLTRLYVSHKLTLINNFLAIHNWERIFSGIVGLIYVVWPGIK